MPYQDLDSGTLLNSFCELHNLSERSRRNFVVDKLNRNLEISGNGMPELAEMNAAHPFLNDIMQGTGRDRYASARAFPKILSERRQYTRGLRVRNLFNTVN